MIMQKSRINIAFHGTVSSLEYPSFPVPYRTSSFDPATRPLNPDTAAAFFRPYRGAAQGLHASRQYSGIHAIIPVGEHADGVCFTPRKG